jgi:integrase
MPKANTGPRLKWHDETGSYYIHWTDKGRSKRRSTCTSDRDLAQQVLAAFLSLGQQAERKAVKGPLLVMDVIGDPEAPEGKDYWHEHVVPNVESKETALFGVKKLLKHFGHLAVVDIHPDDVDEYIEARRLGDIGRPSINATITRELAYLTAAINHAVKKKRLPRNDAPFIHTPGKSPPRDRWLDQAEAARLVAAAEERVDPRSPKDRPTRIYRFVMLALETASRKRAIETLQRKQVDLARGLIYLNPAGRAQTNKRRPPVPISSRLRPVLEQTLLAFDNEAKARGVEPDPDAYILDHAGSIRTSFESCVARAGLGAWDAKGNLDSDVTPHVLRHTKATWMAQAGRDMHEIAGLLGDSVATVTKTYIHHHPDYLRDAVEVGPGTPRLRVVGGKG